MQRAAATSSVPAAVRTVVGSHVGHAFKSMKLIYRDPLTRRVAWRMTIDGTRDGALNSLVDQTGMEGNRWSPDGRYICYGKSRTRTKPKGTYVMNIHTGVETFIADGGTSGRGTCEFGKLDNELYYFHANDTKQEQSSWVELRATNLATGKTRTLQHFASAIDAYAISQNSDGRYLAALIVVGTRPALRHYIVIMDRTGEEIPNWNYDPDATPDMRDDAADNPYWSPVDPLAIRTFRRGVLAIWNIETLDQETPPTIVGEQGLHGSHTCWSADGQVLFHSWGHADCYPLDRGRGDRTRVVLDRINLKSPYLYFTEMRNAAGFDVVPQGKRDVLAVHFNYNTRIGDDHNAHSHPQFSRDGKYVLFASAVTNTSAGAPPGGVDRDSKSVDLFIIPLRKH